MEYKVKYVPDLDPHSLVNIQEPPQERIDQLNTESLWFERLEASVLKDGIKNPICITAKGGELNIRYGGSRLMMAQRHSIRLPAIVADYDDHFPDAECAGDDPTAFVRSKYQDQPKKIFFKPHGINISGCKEIHLEEKE
jgi:hypothetical protein